CDRPVTTADHGDLSIPAPVTGRRDTRRWHMHTAGLGPGLVALSTVLFAVGLFTVPASASERRQLVATGSWTDPGANIDSITPSGRDYIVEMHGGTTTDGDFAGTSTYTLTARANLRTGVTTAR